MFNTPLNFLITWYTLIIVMLERIPDIILSWIATLVYTIRDWLIQFLSQTLPSKVADLLPQEIIDFLNTDIAFELAGLFDMIMWFYPLIEVVGIFASAYTMIFAIRVTRFIVGFIPGVDG